MGLGYRPTLAPELRGMHELLREALAVPEAPRAYHVGCSYLPGTDVATIAPVSAAPRSKPRSNQQLNRARNGTSQHDNPTANKQGGNR